MRKTFIRCVAMTVDGSRCGRGARPGAIPQLCSKHDGTPHSGCIPDPDESTNEMDILRKLARDKNPQVRLRAVDLLITLKRKDEGAAPPERSNDAIAEAASETEAAELRSLIGRVNEIKAQIRQRIASGALPTESAREPLTFPDGKVIYDVGGFLDWCMRRAIPEEEYVGATWSDIVEMHKEWIDEVAEALPS